MNMPARTIAAGLVPALLSLGALTGCAGLVPAATCRGTQDDVRSLERLPLLAAHPEGAVAADAGTPDTGCLGDSDPWLYAGRVYAAPQTAEQVAAFYRDAAVADGWTPQDTPRAAPPEVAGLCLTRTRGGTTRTFELRYLPTPEARTAFGYTTPPGAPGPATVYRVEAGGRADGARTPCLG
jgi:hypothetical protein